MSSHHLTLPRIGQLTPNRRDANPAPRDVALPQLEGKPATPIQVEEQLPLAASQVKTSIESEALLTRLGLTSKVATRQLDFFYGDNQALFDNNLDIAEHRVTAIIGPSGCGKSTHLRIYNRIYELYRDQRASGEVLLDGANILDPHYDIMELRRKVGMIFQKPTPFP
ncbi:MAG: ATP-binding cassette domain-containing protein, partial [Deltaproteobacteria bacterium]|nr:ATP-binding cassette domain-containing protein [Deltaproteobacteria bacterium]